MTTKRTSQLEVVRTVLKVLLRECETNYIFGESESELNALESAISVLAQGQEYNIFDILQAIRNSESLDNTSIEYKNGFLACLDMLELILSDID